MKTIRLSFSGQQQALPPDSGKDEPEDGTTSAVFANAEDNAKDLVARRNAHV